MTLTKVCVHCKIDKPLSEFYVRSGVHNPEIPGHYLSECKICMMRRSKQYLNLPLRIPRAKTEILAINKLLEVGIPALPGKAVAFPFVDVVAWGCVRIEVKYSVYSRRRLHHGFIFNSTPMQRQRGWRAEVVMLICHWQEEQDTFHLFMKDDPVFYLPTKGRYKEGVTYVPGRVHQRKDSHKSPVLTDQLMQSAQNNWGLIEQQRIVIAETIRASKSLDCLFDMNSRGEL